MVLGPNRTELNINNMSPSRDSVNISPTPKNYTIESPRPTQCVTLDEPYDLRIYL